MKEYHIVYKESIEEYYSKGTNIQANTPIEALGKWEEEYLNTHSEPPIFICMNSKDAFSHR